VTCGFEYEADEESMFGKTDTPLSMCSICSGNRQYRPEELEREGYSRKPVSRDRTTTEESRIDDNGVAIKTVVMQGTERRVE
jgi:hypothetical protein